MEASKAHCIEETSIVQQQWRKVYLIGGFAALLLFFGTIADIILGSILSGNLSELPQTAVEWFAEFQQSWLLGLYHLDFLNLINIIIMIPVFFALFSLHTKKNLPYASFALLLSLVGVTIFISTNSALPMLELSKKYFLATDEVQKMLIAAAGEALLVKGGHGSFGAFIGFMLLTLANICMSLVMLNGKVISKITSFLGIIGYTLLLAYVVLVTFVPAVQSIAVIAAAPGGLMALAWMLMVGVRLIKEGRAQ